MTKQSNIRRQSALGSETRRSRRAMQSAMAVGLRSSFKPASEDSKMDEFKALLEMADRKRSKA